MKKFKRKILTLAITIPLPSLKPATGSDLPSKIHAIIQMLLMLVGAAAVLFLIIGGFQFILAAGHPENIQRAKNTVIYSLVGLAIAALSYLIVGFVIQKLK
jgi:hypothetical protein